MRMQAYGVFIIVWQFLLPLVLFVFAYWKILTVIRRQKKVAVDLRRAPGPSTEPVAGPSFGMTAATGIGTENDERQTHNHKESGSRGDRQNTAPKGLSRAQTNVVTTMVFMTVCFAICWIPMYVNVILTRLTVTSVPLRVQYRGYAFRFGV